jgi:2-C-methyl-D-erythritol 4-phosphate cytidylyltransferase
MLACIITAGGFGERFSSHIPKQYHKIGDDYILQKTINIFKAFTSNIVTVIRKEDEEFFKEHFIGEEYVIGGKTRQASVLKGLKFLAEQGVNYKDVLITDGVRPFVSNKLIKEVIRCLHDGELGVILCIKIQDTIKRVHNNYVIETVEREGLFATQTPQGFKFNIIYGLHMKYQNLNLTDDAGLLEKEGIKVKVVEGEKSNIKITTREDLYY